MLLGLKITAIISHVSIEGILKIGIASDGMVLGGGKIAFLNSDLIIT